MTAVPFFVKFQQDIVSLLTTAMGMFWMSHPTALKITDVCSAGKKNRNITPLKLHLLIVLGSDKSRFVRDIPIKLLPVLVEQRHYTVFLKSYHSVQFF